ISTVVHVQESVRSHAVSAGASPKTTGLSMLCKKPCSIPLFLGASMNRRRRSRALDADERTLDSVIAWFVKWGEGVRSKKGRALPSNRKPLAKVEGRRRLRLTGFTIVRRGPPGVDDRVAYIAEAPKSD